MKTLIPKWILFGFALALAALYFLTFRNIVPSVIEGKGPKTIQVLIDKAYPRLQVDRHRFDAPLLQARADQIVLRCCSFLLLAGSLLFLFERNSKCKQYLHHWMTEPCYPRTFHLYRKALYTLVIYLTWDWAYDMLWLGRLHPFYEPVSFLAWLNIPFPLSGFSILYCLSLLFMSLLVVFSFKPLFNSIYSCVLFIVLQAFVFSFGKIDHHLAPITYALVIFPFWVYEYQATNGIFVPKWPLLLIRFAITAPYFFSGLEKLTLSPLEWVNGDQVKDYILFQNEHLLDSFPILNNRPILALIGSTILAFQLTFPLIIFFTRLRWVFIPAGILFHLLIFLLIDIGGWLHPWVLMYFFLIDWHPLLLKNLKQDETYQ